MNGYEGWPPIAQSCPCCGEASVAIFKGYYQRMFVCPEMEFHGWLVIRTGYCKRTGRRFALLPDFVVPRVRVSRVGLLRLLECHRASGGQWPATLEQWTDGLNDEEYYVPRSTALGYLSRVALMPP